MILEGNAFVERVLPGGIMRKLTDEEMAVYRAPSRRRNRAGLPGASRTSCRSRESPPTSMRRSRAHMQRSPPPYPKLLFVADPGALVSPGLAEALLQAP